MPWLNNQKQFDGNPDLMWTGLTAGDSLKSSVDFWEEMKILQLSWAPVFSWEPAAYKKLFPSSPHSALQERGEGWWKGESFCDWIQAQVTLNKKSTQTTQQTFPYKGKNEKE